MREVQRMLGGGGSEDAPAEAEPRMVETPPTLQQIGEAFTALFDLLHLYRVWRYEVAPFPKGRGEAPAPEDAAEVLHTALSAAAYEQADALLNTVSALAAALGVVIEDVPLEQRHPLYQAYVERRAEVHAEQELKAVEALARMMGEGGLDVA